MTNILSESDSISVFIPWISLSTTSFLLTIASMFSSTSEICVDNGSNAARISSNASKIGNQEIKLRKRQVFDRSYVTGIFRYSFQQFKIMIRQLINTRYKIRNFRYQNTMALSRCKAGFHWLLKISHCRILWHIINHHSVLVHQKFNICSEFHVFILNSL